MGEVNIQRGRGFREESSKRECGMGTSAGVWKGSSGSQTAKGWAAPVGMIPGPKVLGCPGPH